MKPLIEIFHPDMNARNYLQDNALNSSEFARRIAWNKTSMSLWLSGKGNIPLDKLKALEIELRGYGYNGDKL